MEQEFYAPSIDTFLPSVIPLSVHSLELFLKRDIPTVSSTSAFRRVLAEKQRVLFRLARRREPCSDRSARRRSMADC